MFNQKDIELPASFYEEDDTQPNDATPEPAVEDAEPELVEEETLEEEALEDSEETEGDETGDEPEESDEVEAQTEDTAKTPSDLLDLPYFDRKSIEGKPELELAYKHMQAAFTRATQEVRTKERETQMMQEEMETFMAEIGSDEGATEFLVKMALHRPKVFEEAFEQAVKLTENPSEKKLFEREQQLRNREREIERENKRREASEQQQRRQAVYDELNAAMKQHGLTEADSDIAQQYVANVILEKKARGDNSISPKEIHGAVERAAKFLSARNESVKQEIERRVRAEQQQAMKKKAQDAKRPAAPKSSKSPGPKAKKLEVPRGVDPLDYIVSARLGLE